MLGNFSCFCCHLLTFFKNQFFKKIFQENYRGVKPFGSKSGPEVIKLEYSLKLKIKGNDWLLADMCPQACVHKQPIIVLYFESENELKFYNLGARPHILLIPTVFRVISR